VLPALVHPPAPDADRLLSATAVPDSRGRVVVEVVGELDTYSAPLLELCLHSQAAQPGLRELVVDLQGVTFLGAAGMSVLADANDRCRRRGARLVVGSGGRPTVLRPLQMTGLAQLIALEPTSPQADRTRGARTPARPRPRPRRAPVRRPQRVCR
jgi:anti-sigma B factor antagonist